MHTIENMGGRTLANKFYPPRIDPATILFRSELVEGLLLRHGREKQAIVIEAQAGQGKTVLALQFLEHIEVPYAWYQIGQEDADPVFFLNTLLIGIEAALPQFSCPLVHKIITAGEVVSADLPKLANMLIADLEAYLSSDFYIAFDDVHLIKDHEVTLSFINYLFETAPFKIHFIFCSREPVIEDNRQSKFHHSNKLIRLKNEDLALTEEETADFYTRVFNTSGTQRSMSNIWRATDGWLMGVVMIGHYLRSKPEAFDQNGLETSLTQNRKEMLRYFYHEVLSLMDEELQRPLLVLSLLEEMTVDLAQQLTGIDSIGKELSRLVEGNYFVRYLDPDGCTFGFQHLFQSFLRDRAAQVLKPDLIRRIYKKAGHHSYVRGRLAQALRYYSKAEDFESIEALLAEEGTVFLANNQTATLTPILAQIPDKELQKHGWSALFAVLSNMDSEPQKILFLLDDALKIFSQNGDKKGELFTISHIISIHISTTGYCRDGETYLERAEEMFYDVADSLSVYMKILIARSLALSFCVLLGDMSRAGRFSTLALNLAIKHRIVNFEAALIMVKGYEQIFSGHTAHSLMFLEQAEPYVHNPEVGIFNALGIRMMLFNFLFHNGDFENYFDQKEQLTSIVGRAVFLQSIAGPFCYIWEIDIALNQGRIDDAMDLTEELLSQPDIELSPHIRSQALQFRGIILALQHRYEEALEAAQESTELRDLAKGNYFISLNKILTGLTHAYCGESEKALELLAAGIEAARQLHTEYLEACGTIHRAWVYLESGNIEAAKRDIETGFRLMQKNAYAHLWAWVPAEMQQVFKYAVRSDVEPAYIHRLASEHLDMAVTETEETIPILEIKTFGGLGLRLEGNDILMSEDLTPTQRTIIATLISSPKLRMGQEQLQSQLWPESSREKARIKFDTLLSRLRSTLDMAVKPYSIKHYLKLQKGVLVLENCRIDAIDFIALSEQGMRHNHLQEYWQAGNLFYRADQLVQGEFAPTVTGDHQIRNFRDRLAFDLQQMSLVWSNILIKSHCRQRAIDLIEKVLQYDPTNDKLVGFLFNLHCDSPVTQSQQVLRRFEDALRQEDYSAEEIAGMLGHIVSDSPV